jgi:hypothetical protein
MAETGDYDGLRNETGEFITNKIVSGAGITE